MRHTTTIPSRTTIQSPIFVPLLMIPRPRSPDLLRDLDRVTLGVEQVHDLDPERSDFGDVERRGHAFGGERGPGRLDVCGLQGDLGDAADGRVAGRLGP